MTCDFKPGDELVALDNGGDAAILPDLKVGSVYVCSAIDVDCEVCPYCESDLGVQVEGIDCSAASYCPCSFRKVQRRDLGEWLKTEVGNTDRIDRSVRERVGA